MIETKEVSRNEKLQKVSDAVANAYTPEQIGVIQQNIAKGTNVSELAYFLNVCKSIELNPFNKEVWCYKDNRGNLLIFAGRDGFLARAQSNPLFNGIRSIEVRENDEFEMDLINNRITHNIVAKSDEERGAIKCGIAVVFRKDGEPTIEVADFDTYNKGFSAWKTHPAEMIKKVAETHALKKAFGISGVQSEYDYDVKGNVAQPINFDATPKLEDIENLYIEVQETLTTDEQQSIDRIIANREENHYNKVYSLLKSKA